ncbi:MAG: ABC-2 family transporter protein [Treponema sp.]|nr:ABC-2 family transporter protein [Treponema sp.]
MFNKYKPFFKAGAMAQMAYKFNLFSWFLISIFEWICLICLWFSVYKASEAGMDSVINGFSFKEMIVYTVLINILTFAVFVNETFGQISDEIKDGTIAISFIRPISYRGRFVAQNLGMVATCFLILALPALILSMLAFIKMGFLSYQSPQILAQSIIFFILTTFFAVLINDAISYIMGIMCFYTTQAFGLNQMREIIVSFLAGALIPVSFFPGKFKDIVNALPFAGLAQNPILILQGKTNLSESVFMLAKNIFWLFVIEILGWLLFKAASKKVTVQGG